MNIIILINLILLSSLTSYNKGLAYSTISERVDMIELNHYYNEDGRLGFDQVIFWEWSPDYCRFHAISWCLLENDPNRKPKYDPNRKDYYCEWIDSDTQIVRQVRSKLYRETWTTIDPERINKLVFEEKYRSSLIRIEKLKND